MNEKKTDYCWRVWTWVVAERMSSETLTFTLVHTDNCCDWHYRAVRAWQHYKYTHKWLQTCQQETQRKRDHVKTETRQRKRYNESTAAKQSSDKKGLQMQTQTTNRTTVCRPTNNKSNSLIAANSSESQLRKRYSNKIYLCEHILYTYHETHQKKNNKKNKEKCCCCRYS